MLPRDPHSEEINETRVEFSGDADVELNLDPIQQYLVYTMANRDETDAPDEVPD
ncbi:hypothetical protein [Vagococcus sp. WN89Y]|uniref:hypothetical protein n=1 Tax=Vagococcus sp. WN89Y TaxID=3457258 RepID=UPI003FCE2657